jgi:lipoate-protein ligase A
MSKNWRLLPFETHDAFMNMAIDEAILRERSKNLVPNTLRLYGWNPSAVSVGRFQDVQREVYADNCRKNAVDIVRRMTGGGTVYHDSENEVTYSVVAAKEDLEKESISGVYEKVYDCIANGLKRLGVNTDFREGDARTCPNLTVCGRKISGSAQSHKLGLVLQHGTILVEVNLERMFTFIRVGDKSHADVVELAAKKITSLRIELGEKVSHKKICEALVEGFAYGLRTGFTEQEITEEEQKTSERLCAEKYATDAWNLSSETCLA